MNPLNSSLSPSTVLVSSDVSTTESMAFSEVKTGSICKHLKVPLVGTEAVRTGNRWKTDLTNVSFRLHFGLERRLDFLLVELVPVDIPEERMILYLSTILGAQTLGRITSEQLAEVRGKEEKEETGRSIETRSQFTKTGPYVLQNALGLVRDITREAELAVQNFLVHDVDVLGVERWLLRNRE